MKKALHYEQHIQDVNFLATQFPTIGYTYIKKIIDEVVRLLET